jgi:hypothetical protein
MNGSRKCGIYTQWSFTHPWRRMKSCHCQVNRWNWRTSFWVRLARLRRPKIICSPSYAEFRSRANAAMWLDLGHMTNRVHTREIWEYVENPKHESIWCPHSRETNTELLKQQRSTWEGDQESVKRSVRDESTWVATHLYMEAMLGISLYNYP